MRVIAKMDGTTVPATFHLIVHGAPHRRMHVRMIQQYREEIRRACDAAAISTPIDTTVDLSVMFIDPTSPDYDNLLCALYQAMDGATLKKPGILTDDRLIGTVRRLAKYSTT
jgi:Holliday junction resolvase RusA-like endonuclease